MSKWGLANGVAAGWILRDLVLGGEAAVDSGKYTRMIDARRWDLTKSALSVAQASLHTAKHLVGDKIKAAGQTHADRCNSGRSRCRAAGCDCRTHLLLVGCCACVCLSAVSSDISKLRPGEGGLCKVNGETVGAYLDSDGKYHLVKPICTHLGCEVLFNQGDKCWSASLVQHTTGASGAVGCVDQRFQTVLALLTQRSPSLTLVCVASLPGTAPVTAVSLRLTAV